MSEHQGIFTSAAVQDYLSAEATVSSEQLSDRLWTVSDGKYRSLFVEAESSVVAFDTFGTPARARAYATEISRRIPGKPVSTIIYTHDHLDHAGFAADLAPDARIVADEMAAKVVALRNADGQLAVTDALSGRQHEVNFDGAEFVLLNRGPVHGTGHLSAYFEPEKLFFSSDTILPNARYGLMPDYHIANFVRIMRSFLDLEFERFIPGRYEVSDRGRFQEGCDYIEAMQTACQQAFISFTPIWVHDAMAAYVQNELGERFGHLDGFEEHSGQTAIRIVHHYLMGGWGLEDTPEPGILLASETQGA
jgi:glyoxylase-like metal-dependent hydrolase (beta-lactamase superfamily II)